MLQSELEILEKAAHILAREAESGWYWYGQNEFLRCSDEIERLMKRAEPFVLPDPPPNPTSSSTKNEP